MGCLWHDSARHTTQTISHSIGFDGPPQDFQVRFFPQRLWPERTYQFSAQAGKTTLRIQDPLRQPLAQKQLETVVKNGAEALVRIRIPLDELQRPAESRLTRCASTCSSPLMRPAVGSGGITIAHPAGPAQSTRMSMAGCILLSLPDARSVNR
jgi:hypothetical protein